MITIAEEFKGSFKIGAAIEPTFGAACYASDVSVELAHDTPGLFIRFGRPGGKDVLMHMQAEDLEQFYSLLSRHRGVMSSVSRVAKRSTRPSDPPADRTPSPET